MRTKIKGREDVYKDGIQCCCSAALAEQYKYPQTVTRLIVEGFTVLEQLHGHFIVH